MLYVCYHHADRGCLTNANSRREAQFQAMLYFELDEDEAAQLRILPLPVLPEPGETVGLDVRF